MSVSEPIVFVVEDEAVVRDTIVRRLRQAGLEVAAFASAEDFLKHSIPDRPACLVLDVMLPGSTGFELFETIRRADVDMPTIFMTGDGDIPMGVRAMKEGAVEFLTKPLDWETLRRAIEQALVRSTELRARRVERDALEGRLASLTAREHEVLHCVIAGRLNKQIATDLGIVEQTVKMHRAQIMRKLEADSVADLVRMTERLAALKT